MKDITIFCEKNSIKPVLQKVYVWEDNDNKYAVATDSFRLVEWKIKDDFLKEHINCGFYDIKNWKEMCKSYNKKSKDLMSFQNAMLQANELHNNFNEEFPSYKKIIPTDLFSFDDSVIINPDYFFDFVSLIPLDKTNRFYFNKIKQNEKMIYYKDDSLTIVLMKMISD